MTKQEAIKELEKITWSDRGMEAIRMAIEALKQQPIIHCEECKHHGTSNCPMWGDDTTEDYMWCCDGERKEQNDDNDENRSN